MRILSLLAVAAASFVAGGFFWDDLLFRMPRYCLGGIEVMDGNTLRCEWRTIRLAGFDAPESMLQNVECPEEKQLGDVAACTLRQLVAKHRVLVRPLGVRDKSYGRRPLADLIVDGSNVRDTLIAQGLARPYTEGEAKTGWCDLIRSWPELLERKCPQPAP